ncbi:TonB-dependent receptor [Geovibrio sp. ADMFC3]
MKRFILGVSVFAFCVCSAAADDNLMTTTIYLEEVSVTAASAGEENLNITEKEVAEKNRSGNIADFLVKDPEISFKRKAVFGDSGDIISIRGMESKRIMLNLDGRSISSTGNVGGNYIDFGTIPLDNIEKLEIIKGGSSAEYGNNALGGVINAYTKRPAKEASASIYATMGGWDNADDYHNIRGSFAKRFGNLGISLGASHQEADAYLRNNDYESLHINPKFYLTLPWKGELILGYKYSKTERGLIRSNRADGNPTSDSDSSLPGFDTAIDSDYPTASGEYFAGGTPTPSMNVIGDGAYWDKIRHMLDITYIQPLSDNVYIEAMAYKNYEDRYEKNYADVAARVQVQKSPMDTFDPSLTSDGDLVLDRKIEVDRSYGYKFKAVADYDKHTVTAGAEVKALRSGGIDVRYVDTNYNKHGSNGWTGTAQGSSGSEADVQGFFISDSYRVTDKLSADFGIRYDRYEAESGEKSYEDGKATPKAGLTYAVTPYDRISVYVYQNYRTPTLPELWWNSQSSSDDGTVNVPYLIGKKIKPETATGLDIAYRHSFSGKGFARLSGFYYDIEDYILHKAVYVNRPQSYQAWAAYNTDAVFYGVTFDGAYDMTRSLNVRFSSTYQQTEKKSDPADPDGVLEEVDYIPDVKGSAGISWNITKKLSLDAGLNYTGKRFYTVNTASLDKGELGSYTTVDASLQYKLDEHTVLEIYGENLTDKEYEETWGYPAMGLNMGASIKWTL